MKIQIIAFYLPQFHPFPENDGWWGKGFTEWTNVGKAKSLFRGHNQPRVPTELGYYDLRLPIVREQQAKMAQEAGVTAFCYWHYWFGNGKRLIADVFDEVLKSGKPDFPFCLGWANHSWYAKNWNSDGSTTDKLLIEQTYPGLDDQKMHFSFLLNAFKDSRYVKIENKPVLYIFDPVSIPKEYIENFRRWTKEAGFDDLYLVGNLNFNKTTREELIDKGFNAVTSQKIDIIEAMKSKWKVRACFAIRKIKAFVLRRPARIIDFRKLMPYLITKEDSRQDVIPSIMPQWDHSPRSGKNGLILVNANPQNFYHHVLMALDAIRNKPDAYKVLFLKSWNEWGEGNFMEPDITYGRGFIDALRKALDDYESGENS